MVGEAPTLPRPSLTPTDCPVPPLPPPVPPATGHCVDIRLWVPGLYKIDVLLTDPSAATQTPLHVELSLLAIDRTA